MSNATVKIEKEDLNVYGKTLAGNNTYGEYVHFSAGVVGYLFVGNEKFWFEYQTGHGFEHNDYNYPTNEFDVYDDNGIVEKINRLGEQSILDEDEDAKETLEELKELSKVSELDFDDLHKIYIEIRDNVPRISDFDLDEDDLSQVEEE